MTLREELVAVALKWQEQFGVAPHVTSAVAEYDAAKLVGMLEDDYGVYMNGRTAVSKGADFEYEGRLYQIKANRPSRDVKEALLHLFLELETMSGIFSSGFFMIENTIS